MMTPGTYIGLRREAAGLSLEVVAALLATDPHVPARRRVDWLASIEADREDVSERVALALVVVLPIDFAALSLLVTIAAGAQGVTPPRVCAHCGAGPIVRCSGTTLVRSLRDLPGEILAMSRAAMLQHCRQPDTIGGTIFATLIAREAGWLPSHDGLYRRPVLVAELRS
jgi:hypothetical protein